jgi:hypothetical protein
MRRAAVGVVEIERAAFDSSRFRFKPISIHVLQATTQLGAAVRWLRGPPRGPRSSRYVHARFVERHGWTYSGDEGIGGAGVRVISFGSISDELPMRYLMGCSPSCAVAGAAEPRVCSQHLE